MKYLILLSFVISLASCNTTIGLYRDTKAGVIWTKNKIQQSRNGGGGGYEYGAPVY